MAKSIRLESHPAPVVEVPPAPAPIPAEIYLARMNNACARAKVRGLDYLAVYGDREHSANMEYLTGFDPRFEEALLLLAIDGHSKLLVGNECLGYTPDPALGIDVELFQEFSLLGQPRGQSRPLRTILSELGYQKGARVGTVGWKYFDGALVSASGIDIPAYLADILRELCGPNNICNATDLFMDAQEGLRTFNEPEQIAHFEYASNVAASGVLDLLAHMQAGIPEWELERHLDSRGLPLTCHRMIGSGEKARRGLASPSANKIQIGDPYTIAFGVTGALTCRAGCVSRGPEELRDDLREFYPRFAANYFEVIATWYECVRVGLTGDEVFRAVDAVRDGLLFDFAVNPGHQLHLEEWLNSPFSANNMSVLKSGMALQMDIIPVSTGPFCYINAEDGVVLADDALQASVAQSMPSLWDRFKRRRATIRESFGINLHDSVLPLSDLTGWLAPYSLDLSRVFVKG